MYDTRKTTALTVQMFCQRSDVCFLIHCLGLSLGFPGGLVVKNPSANAGDTGDVGLIPGSVRSPGERNGNPFQYSSLENHMDGGAM